MSSHITPDSQRIEPAAHSQAPAGLPQKDTTSDLGIDVVLLDESLAKSVWERMLANDDALRLAGLLQAAMVKAI